MNGQLIETDRLTICAFQPDDLPTIHRILDETFGDGSQVEDAAALRERESWLHWSILSQEWLPKMYQPPYGDRAIALKATGELIGSAGYVPLLAPFTQFAEFGGSATPGAQFTPEVGLFWVIDPRCQRQGYATEAAQALIDHAFGEWRLQRILAMTGYDNIASQGVMRKVGMTVARNPFPDPPWLQVVGILENKKE